MAPALGEASMKERHALLSEPNEKDIMKRITVSTIILLALSAPLALAQKKGGPGIDRKSTPLIVAKAETIDTDFTAARAAFESGDKAKASTSIRNAATLIKKQASTANPEYAEDLNKAQWTLEKLASGIDKGTVKKAEELDVAFASTHQSMAKYFQGKADRSLAAGDKVAAGEAMQGVANNLESGAEWAGEKLTEGGTAIIGLLRKTGGSLVGGVGSGVEVGGDVLKGGLSLITKLGGAIKGKSALSDDDVTGKAKAATGGVVEGTGKTVEKGGDAVKAGGGLIKKVGDAIKGDKEKAPEE